MTALAFAPLPAVGRRPYTADVQTVLDDFASDVNLAFANLPVVSGAAIIANQLGDVGWDYTAVRANLGVSSTAEADAQYASIARQVIAGTGLSGGGVLSGDVTVAMPAVGTAGTYGDGSHTLQLVLDAQGRVSGVTALAISGGGAVLSVNTRTGSVTGLAEDSAVAHLTGNETIAGIKTFSTAPVVPDASFTEAKVTNLVGDLAIKANALAPLNARPLRRFREKLATAEAAPVVMLHFGDSITECVGLGPYDRWVKGLADATANAVGLPNQSPGYLCAKAITGLDLWTGSAGTLGKNGIGYRSWLSASGSSNTHQLVIDNCTGFWLYYTKGPTYGGFTITLDGSVVATIDANAGSLTAVKWDSGVLTRGSHTLLLTTVNTQTNATYLVDVAGALPLDGNATTGVQMFNGGHSFSPSWVPGVAPSTAVELQHITLIDPDIVFVNFGANDLTLIPGGGTPETTGGPPSFTKANFEATFDAVTAAVAHPLSFVFSATWGANANAAVDWEPYVATIYQAALDKGAHFQNFYETLGHQSTSGTDLSDTAGHTTVDGSKAYRDVAIGAIGLANSAASDPLDAYVALTRATFGSVPAVRMGDGSGLFSDSTKYGYLSRLSGGQWALTGPSLAASILRLAPAAKTTSYTLTLADAGHAVHYNSTSAGAFTVPPNSSVAFELGTMIEFFDDNTGDLTITAGAGVTIDTSLYQSLVISAQNGSTTIRKYGTDLWKVIASTDMSTTSAGILGFSTTYTDNAVALLAPLTSPAFVTNWSLTDATAAHGKITAAVGVLGPGISLFGDSGDAAAKAFLGSTGMLLGPGGSTAADFKLLRTGTAAGAVTGVLTMTSPVINTGVSGTAVDTDSTFATGASTTVTASSAVKTALALKANLASPTFTGTVVLPAATVTLAMQVNAAANSIRGNNTGSPAVPADLTVAQTKTLLNYVVADISDAAPLAAPAFSASWTVTDATTSHGKILANVGGLGAAIQLYGDSGDSSAKVSIATNGLQIGPGGAGAADYKLLRTGTAAGTLTGQTTVATGLTMGSGINIATNTGTGTIIATTTSQKLGFFGATAIVQEANSVDLGVVLSDLGFRASGGNPPLNLGTGAVTCGAITASGNVALGDAITDTLGFYGTTAVAQRANANQVAAATTAATNVTPFGYSTAAQADAIQKLANEMRTVLVNLGLMKGAA